MNEKNKKKKDLDLPNLPLDKDPLDDVKYPKKDPIPGFKDPLDDVR